MKARTLRVALAAALALLPFAAFAADNLLITERTGLATATRATDLGSSIKLPWHTLANTAGVNALTAAGSSASTLLTIQGHASGVAVPVSGSITCSNCSGSGVSAADKSAFTSGTTAVVAASGLYQTTATANPLVDGQQGAAQLTINRALHVNLRNTIGVAISPLTDTELRATALPVSGTVTANIGTAGTLALAANQTNATQKTQIVDGAGAVIASTANALNVQCANCSGSGLSQVDKSTFTASTSGMVSAGGFFQTTATANPLTTGQMGAWQMTATRAGFVNLRDSAGTEILPSTESTLAAQSAKLPASLGTKSAATSLSVTPSTEFDLKLGTLTETAPATDTASSGINGRLQRVAQNVSAVTGSKAPGTAAASALLAAGVYNSTPPTLTNGQQASLQFDSAGQLKIVGSISGAGDASAANQVTSNAALGAPADAAYGGSGSATIVAGIKGLYAAIVAPLSAGTNIIGGAIPSPSASSAFGNVPVVTTAAGANQVLKAAAGNLYKFQATTGATSGFVLIFNATSAPADGAVTPVKCYQAPANSTVGDTWPIPLVLSTGITISFSSTGCFTKTASATAFISGEVQ